MAENKNIQDGLRANIGRLYGSLSGYSWGAYPGECDYARRERLREPKPKPPYPDQQSKLNDDGKFPY